MHLAVTRRRIAPSALLLSAAALLVVLAPAAVTATDSPSPSRSLRQSESVLRIALLAKEGTPLLGLLEARLIEGVSASWVERNEIDKVLAEQQIQAAFGAEAIDRRTALGKLLKADLLVLLQGGEKPQPHLQMVICETRHGLRLSVQPIRLTAKPEADVAAVVRLVQETIQRQRQKVLHIVAVPPLLNKSLTYEADHLKRAYAELIEARLLARPGVLVVELAEARAIARELALSGAAGIERRLPLYVLGEYRLEGAGEKRTAQFTLKLMRGDRQLDARGQAALPPDQLAAKIRLAAIEMIDKALGQAAEVSDPQTEVRQLAERGAIVQGDRGLARGAGPGGSEPAVGPQATAPAPGSGDPAQHDVGGVGALPKSLSPREHEEGDRLPTGGVASFRDVFYGDASR